MLKKFLFYVGAFFACGLMAVSSGCASGGFKLTRQYARWVNSQNIILRIIIYILTGIVFVVTMLIDAVVFNTLDFWDGKVSEGKYEFKDEDKTYHVHHEFIPGTQRRRSTIQTFDKDSRLLQEVVLNETPEGEIQMKVDGQLRAQVRDLDSLPVATLYNSSGQTIENKFFWFTLPQSQEKMLASQ